MSKLFDDASLAMIPSAYKDSKLYSIRPTDGSGDFIFSRGSNLAATRVDANGLIEKGRENLLLQSNSFDTTWTNARSSGTSGQSGYDGSLNAWLLSDAVSVNNDHIIYNPNTHSGVVTYSVYAKANTLNWFELSSYSGGTTINSFFDLENGVIGSGTNIEAKIEAVGTDGWYRCSVTGYTTTNNYVRIALATGDNTTNWVGTNGENSIYIQDAQLEQGLVATDYIETGASTAQAGILEDMPRLDYSGGASCPSLLLEPQRSNLITQSEYIGAWTGFGGVQTITDNYATSPEGLQNAARVQLERSPSLSRIQLSVTGTSNGVAFVYSVYLKANSGSPYVYLQAGPNFSTAIEVTNEWERYDLVGTASGGTTTCIIGISDSVSGTTETADILVYGAQLESSASYPTSYIPTYGSSVTRSKDLAVSPTDTFDSLSTFTWFFEISRLGFSSDSTSAALTLRTSNGAEQIRCHFDFPFEQIRIRDAVNGYTTIGAPINVNANTYYKLCVVSDGITMKTFVNGTQRGGVYTIVTQHDVDRTYMDGKGFDCKQLLVFPTALTDSECIALTTL